MMHSGEVLSLAEVQTSTLPGASVTEWLHHPKDSFRLSTFADSDRLLLNRIKMERMEESKCW